jgi:hypothetical protein
MTYSVVLIPMLLSNDGCMNSFHSIRLGSISCPLGGWRMTWINQFDHCAYGVFSVVAAT